MLAGAVGGGALGFGVYWATHRDDFRWTEAAAWTAGGAIIGATLGAGAELAGAFGRRRKGMRCNYISNGTKISGRSCAP